MESKTVELTQEELNLIHGYINVSEVDIEKSPKSIEEMHQLGHL